MDTSSAADKEQVEPMDATETNEKKDEMELEPEPASSADPANRTKKKSASNGNGEADKVQAGQEWKKGETWEDREGEKREKNKEKGGGQEETEKHGRLPLGILFSQQQFGLPQDGKIFKTRSMPKPKQAKQPNIDR